MRSMLALASFAACQREPITWGPLEYLAADTVAPAPAGTEGPLCGIVEVRLYRNVFRAAWNTTTGALTVMGTADEGGVWDAPVIADPRPADPPCDRPPPAVFPDSGNSFLHVAYFLARRGEAGVYYAHSMNAQRLRQMGEGMFEQPIPITYGHRPVRTSVASRGDTVAVAYEDPNSTRGGIQLAISTTGGHSFDTRVSVPAGPGSASMPRVELRAGEVTVMWQELTGTTRQVRRRGVFR